MFSNLVECIRYLASIHDKCLLQAKKSCSIACKWELFDIGEVVEIFPCEFIVFNKLGCFKKIVLKKVVMVYDNEPRNKEIVKKMEKSVDEGRKIVVWPSKINHKDINDMVIAGMRCADIRLIIQNNTFSDLSAKMALNVWKRI